MRPTGQDALRSHILDIKRALSLSLSLLTRSTCSQSGTVTRASAHAIHRGRHLASGDTHRQICERTNTRNTYTELNSIIGRQSHRLQAGVERRHFVSPIWALSWAFHELIVSRHACVNVLQRIARRSTVTVAMNDDVRGRLIVRLTRLWPQTAGWVHWLGISSVLIKFHNQAVEAVTLWQL